MADVECRAQEVRLSRRRKGNGGDREDGALIGCNLRNDHDPAAGPSAPSGDALIRVDERSLAPINRATMTA